MKVMQFFRLLATISGMSIAMILLSKDDFSFVFWLNLAVSIVNGFIYEYENQNKEVK